MNPLRNLGENHLDISLALDAIDAAIAAAGQGDFDLRRFERLVNFIEHWADGAH